MKEKDIQILMLKDAMTAVEGGGNLLEVKYVTKRGTTGRYWTPKKKSPQKPGGV
jgi:hypothetical protein